MISLYWIRAGFFPRYLLNYNLLLIVSACDPFLLVPGTASQGGTEITGPNTVAACKADCAADAQCVGFDFNTNQNKCYRHISTSAWSTTRQATAVNQYRKTGTCQGPSSTAAPPAATTATVAPGAGTTTCKYWKDIIGWNLFWVG